MKTKDNELLCVWNESINKVDNSHNIFLENNNILSLNLFRFVTMFLSLFACRRRYLCGHMWDASSTGKIITGDFKCFEVGQAALPILIFR